MSTLTMPVVPAHRGRVASLPPASLSAALLKIDRLMDIAVFPGRTEHSSEYQEGCRAALEFRLLGRRIHAPYAAGCSAADAFAAGLAEGHAIWRRQFHG